MGVPEGWDSLRLGDLTGGDDRRLTDGDWIESKDQDPDGDIRLLQVGNVLTGRMKLGGNHRWVNRETAARLRCNRLVEGDILIARLPDPLGRAAMVPKLPYEAITAVDCAIFRPDPQVADPSFVVQFLNSDYYFKAVLEYATGTTRTRISRKNLAGLGLVLPPLPEQRKIAAILSSVDEAIEATQAVIDQLQVVKKGLMQELLTKGLPGRHKKFKQTEIGQIPEEWEVVRIGDVSTVRSGATPSRKNPEFFAAGDSGHPWVKTMDLTDGAIRTTDERITELALAKTSCRLNPPGTILVAMYGGFGQIGRSGVLEVEAATNQAISCIDVERSRFDPWFVNDWLVTARPRWRNIAASSRKDPNITRTDVLGFHMPCPPLEEQRRIVEQARAVSDRLGEELSCVVQMGQLKKALMSVLLTGELRVQPEAAK